MKFLNNERVLAPYSRVRIFYMSPDPAHFALVENFADVVEMDELDGNLDNLKQELTFLQDQVKKELDGEPGATSPVCTLLVLEDVQVRCIFLTNFAGSNFFFIFFQRLLVSEKSLIDLFTRISSHCRTSVICTCQHVSR